MQSNAVDELVADSVASLPLVSSSSQQVAFAEIELLITIPQQGSTPFMNSFETYFSDGQIIRELCKARIKVAEQRNERSYVNRLIGGKQPRMFENYLDDLLPPRRQWVSFRPRFRRTGLNPDSIALLRATSNLRISNPEAPWVIRLNTYIRTIQQRVLGSPTFAFARPEVSWQLKEEHKYRPLCRFGLDDNLINGLAARYLRDFFDPVFESSSFAFRAPGPNRNTPTYHTAFNQIYETRQANTGKNLYVAECDIRGFYDCVDHDIAMASFNRLAHLVEQRLSDQRMDPRAANIFRAYLDCYSFPTNTLGQAETRLKSVEARGYFPWPNEALKKYHTNPMSVRIGVPQGGAISCIISNLVLDLADKRIRDLQSNVAELRYLRYCDDMILIASSRRACQNAFQTYLAALDELKLPYHPAKSVQFYGKSFWEGKSRAPYCWSGRKWFGCVPWIQFVGYQIRYDGLVRPKQKSIKKQVNALKETVDGVKFRLMRKSRPFPRPYEKPAIKSSRMQAQHSVLSKLVCKGVGRVKLHQPKDGPMPMCWANGFKSLHQKPLVPTFLKQLDRERERQIRRFNRAPINYGFGRTTNQSGKRHVPEGYPYSYAAQFPNSGGVHLLKNPYRGPWFERWFLEPLFNLCAWLVCRK